MLEGRAAISQRRLAPSKIRLRDQTAYSSGHLEGAAGLRREATRLPARGAIKAQLQRIKIYQSARPGWGPKERQVIKHINGLRKSMPPPCFSLPPHFYTSGLWSLLQHKPFILPFPLTTPVSLQCLALPLTSPVPQPTPPPAGCSLCCCTPP